MICSLVPLALMSFLTAIPSITPATLSPITTIPTFPPPIVAFPPMVNVEVEEPLMFPLAVIFVKGSSPLSILLPVPSFLVTLVEKLPESVFKFVTLVEKLELSAVILVENEAESVVKAPLMFEAI